VKRRSGTAQAAQHRHAGPMKHRLQGRGGARNEQAELLAESGMDTEKIQAALAIAGITVPAGTILDARYLTRSDDWYVRTNHGWFWWDSRTHEWRSHATGP
jgi:hypothetical protein